MDSLRYFVVPLTTATGIVGFLLGGQYVWLGVATFPLFLILDIVLPSDLRPRRGNMGRLADIPLHLQLPLMIGLYAAFAWSVRAGINPVVGEAGAGWQLAGSIATLAWLSAVPTLPVAHEFMHRRHWFPRAVAKCLSAFYGDPNRDVAHVVTHHVHLNTPKDSDTPRRGQTIYSFVFQATWGAYKDTFEKQRDILVRQGYSPWSWRNAMWLLLVLVGTIPLFTGLYAGWAAALTALAAVFIAKLALEGFNYFQHYGLVRVEGTAIELHHAWNHLGMVARPLGCEITNHINHHLDGHIPFYELKPEPQAPQMPSLFLCFVCGLVPPVWHRLIARPRLKDWDMRFASSEERKIADAENVRAGWSRLLPAD